MSSNNRKDPSAAVRGELRKAHFESGGSLREWRGTHVIHKSKRDKRKGNRSQQNMRAIRNSEE